MFVPSAIQIAASDASTRDSRLLPKPAALM